MSRIIHPDEEIWYKAGFDKSDKYERIPIPTEVTKFLKRKVGDCVLLCHYVEGKHDAAVMHYVEYNCGCLMQRGGYSFGIYPEEPLKDTLVRVAKSIAEDWPRFAVKKRNVSKE